MVAFAATGAYLYWKRRRDFMKKRRVKRGANGLKSEVVSKCLKAKPWIGLKIVLTRAIDSRCWRFEYIVAEIFNT